MSRLEPTQTEETMTMKPTAATATADATPARRSGAPRLLFAGLAAALALTLALALAAPARADYGFVPGSSVGKVHDPVRLVCGIGGGVVDDPQQDCLADRDAIAAAPHLSQAGAHPDATAAGKLTDVPDSTRDFIVDAPPGFVGDPTVVTECTRERFAQTHTPTAPPEAQCPISSQIGVISLFASGQSDPRTQPIYRLTATPGFPATFGFKGQAFAVPIVVNANVRTDGDHGIRISTREIIGQFRLIEVLGATLWGIPGDPVHDDDRWNPFSPSDGPLPGNWGALSAVPPAPLLETPADCSNEDLVTTVQVRSWQGETLPDDLPPGDPRRATYAVPAPKPTGCDQLFFDPAITLNPTIKSSDSPTGVSVSMEIPQTEDPDLLATPPLRKAVVTLPEGMSVNPAAADGQAACSSEQIGLLTTHGRYPNPIRFAAGDANCPVASKVGSLTVKTPVLDEDLPGDVYLAAPHDNPFDSLLAIYLVVRGPGFVIKLPGEVKPDPETGQLTTTFDHNPQLPFSDLDIDFFGGPRASLATSPLCGTQEIETELTPWSHPDSGPPATPENRYQATQGPAGAPCSSTLASRPFSPTLSAGSASPIAGDFSPLTMRITRPDGHQELERLVVKPPLGFTAKLAGIPFCSERAIELAETRSGSWTAQHPDCPDASRVGRVLTGAGAGPTPFFVEGDAYLAGPYEGAPLSMVVITPALAGGTPENPVFDLGTVVVRVALHVDPRDAQITAISDPIPQILEGIPLRVKDIRVVLDRPEFGVNPTSCEAKAFEVTAHGASGAVTDLQNRYQSVECASLDFGPRFNFRAHGKRATKPNGHPSLTARVRFNEGDANVADTSVILPRRMIIDQDNIATTCTRAQFAQRECPEETITGSAIAHTPLLDEPLEGPVYLIASENPLPDIVADLQGIVNVTLFGRVHSQGIRIRNTFDVVPDAAVSRFRLTIDGGPDGMLVNGADLCRKPKFRRVDVNVSGQNGAVADQRTLIQSNRCLRKRTNRLDRRMRRLRQRARKAARNDNTQRAKRLRQRAQRLSRKQRRVLSRI